MKNLKVTGEQLMKSKELQDKVLGKLSVRRVERNVTNKNLSKIIIKGEPGQIDVNKVNEKFIYTYALSFEDVKKSDVITFYTVKGAKKREKHVERILHRYVKRDERLHQGRALLWKYDEELGIAYCCPHCKSLFIGGDGLENCESCGQTINNSIPIMNQYKGVLNI